MPLEDAWLLCGFWGSKLTSCPHAFRAGALLTEPPAPSAISGKQAHPFLLNSFVSNQPQVKC